jgi:hypothetical protein
VNSSVGYSIYDIVIGITNTRALAADRAEEEN